MTASDLFNRFRALHDRAGAFVIANAWDAGTARILTALGYEALATTSAGYAFSTGRRDSAAALGRGDILANAAAIAAATDLPVSADLEDGFGPAPKECAETIRQAATAGLVGGSIEDATGDAADPIMQFDLAVDRIRAARSAARGRSFLLTARAENFLGAVPIWPTRSVACRRFPRRGRMCSMPPACPILTRSGRSAARWTSRSNVLMGLQGATYSVAELADAGARRISVGGSFARAALGAMMRAAT